MRSRRRSWSLRSRLPARSWQMQAQDTEAPTGFALVLSIQALKVYQKESTWKAIVAGDSDGHTNSRR